MGAIAIDSHALVERGLPIPDRDYLSTAFDESVWQDARASCGRLSEHFAKARYSGSAVYGPLLVPNPERFDVRAALPIHVRESQHEITKPDFVDEHLPHGADHACPESDWTLFAALVSEAGIAMGSYNEVTAAPSGVYSVGGCDTRLLMTRQLWCSLVLQNPLPPDSELRSRWTFCLFAGEETVDERVVSGTVLHGQVRQRLGKRHLNLCCFTALVPQYRCNRLFWCRLIIDTALSNLCRRRLYRVQCLECLSVTRLLLRFVHSTTEYHCANSTQATQ